jgi:hypothetical protein
MHHTWFVDELRNAIRHAALGTTTIAHGDAGKVVALVGPSGGGYARA